MMRYLLLLGWSLFFCLPFSASATVEPESKLMTQKYMPSVPVSSYKYDYKESAKGQATIDFEYWGDHGKTERQYQIYLPSEYHSGRRYPLLVLLHGSERTGVSVVQKWIPLAEKIGIVLLGPSHPDRDWPLTKEEVKIEADIIEAMVEQVQEKIAVDPRRTYIFGTSSGGDLALYMTFLKPYLFASIAVHDAYLRNMEDYLRAEEPDHKIPVAFIAGTNDRRAPIDKVRDSADFLARQGHFVLLIEFLGHNDWYYTIASEINAKAIRFMSLYKNGVNKKDDRSPIY